MSKTFKTDVDVRLVLDTRDGPVELFAKGTYESTMEEGHNIKERVEIKQVLLEDPDTSFPMDITPFLTFLVEEWHDKNFFVHIGMQLRDQGRHLQNAKTDEHEPD